MEVSAEVTFAQTLASNEKKFRDKALKKLHKYIGVRSLHGDGFSHEDLVKIWKGLHYCMWMQDKPLIQEELSEKIVRLIHAFPRLEDALKFVNVFFITEAREWSGIDRFRLDKFMMLVRGVLHEAFVVMASHQWPLSACQSLAQYLTSSVMDEKNAKLPLELKSHLADIYLTEMGKVSLDRMTGKKLMFLLFPFIYLFVMGKRRPAAMKIFNMTVQEALRQHGIWAWKMNNASKSQKTSESDTDSSDEMDEEEGMDVDEEGEDKKRKPLRFDLTSVVRLVQQIAESTKVNAVNRSALYGFVRSYTRRDPGILHKNDSSEAGSESEHNNCAEIDEAILLKLMGETENGKRRKKKKKNKKENIENESNDKTSEAMETCTTSPAQQTKTKKDKKKKSISNNIPDASDEKKGKKRKRDSVDETDNMKLTNENTDTNTPNKGNEEKSETSSPDKKKRKKEKQSVENEVSPAVQITSPSSDTNTNTNARSSPSPKSSGKKKAVSMVNANMEMKVYSFKPPKSPKHTPTPSGKAGLVLTATSPPKPTADQPSPSPSDSAMDTTPSAKGKSPKKKSKKTQDEQVSSEAVAVSPSGDGSTTSLFNNLYKVVSAPGSLIRKAVGMVTPSSSTSAVNHSKTASPLPKEGTPTTPGSQKKVIFDLRRNKANKFQDYLKTLASEMPPAFEPGKSPSQSILKSPSTSSLTPSPVVQIGLRPSPTLVKSKSPGKAASPKLSLNMKSPKVKKTPSPKRRGVRSPSLKRLR